MREFRGGPALAFHLPDQVQRVPSSGLRDDLPVGDVAGAGSCLAPRVGEAGPTVVVAGRPHTTPDPAWVREELVRST